jgi:hypothetical protein
MKTMHKKLLLFSAVLLTGMLQVAAQTGISGTVSDNKKHPLADASVIIRETGVGTVTDSAGRFSIAINDRKSKTIEVSALGYQTKTVTVNAVDSFSRLHIVLKVEHQMLGEVVVNAGSFEASDKAKGASLTPMDAVTVAGNGGDLANALRSLPGAQQIGEREGLFVRGGTGTETKQFVDGALLPNPNFASVPGLAQPAHLNPFLFHGILFSAGGYSALYGDALSSALILQTVDLPDKSSADLHIFPTSQGMGFQELAKDNKSSYGVDMSYGNQQLYNRVVPQTPDFFHGPEYFTADGNFRMKTGRSGMLKLYTNYGYSNVGMRNPDIDSSSLLSSFQNRGKTLYANLSYRGLLGKQWKIDAVIASNNNRQQTNTALLDSNKQEIRLADTPFNAKNNAVSLHADFAQARTVLTKTFRRRQAIRFGAEYFLNRDAFADRRMGYTLRDNRIAAFAEADIYLAGNIAVKPGIRYEYSGWMRKAKLAPRVSLAYKFYDGGQLSLAYGVFYERPEPEYVYSLANPDFSKATHYIINYQKKANNRFFRIEAYYKRYQHLVTSDPAIANRGTGYARGIELFFRDKRTFKNFDYWITYTYLDTKRQYLNYPAELYPDFATPHTGSIAIKRFFPDINFNVNLSYSLATGRPYYNIQQDPEGKSFIYDQGRTRMYNTMNLSFAYLFTFIKRGKYRDFSGIGFGINNVFGTKQVFGYNYSYDGTNKVPVTLPAARNYYIGLFMSLGTDMRNDFIDQNL